MEMLNQKQKTIAIAIIAIVVIVIAYYYINSTKEVYSSHNTENLIEEDEESKKTENKVESETIKIHITGSVKTNGIVELEKNSRINDAIEEAGGITDDADLSEVNLAYMLEDGQKIYIPSIDDENEEDDEEDDNEDEDKGKQNIISTKAGHGITEEDSSNSNSKTININKANLTELITLPGVGESTAVKILEYRKTNGKFSTIEQIKNVPGIGEAKFNVIKEYISV